MTSIPLAPIAVVTGASSGIGRFLATEFGDRGFDLVLCAEDPDIHRVSAELAQGGRWTRAVQADLRTAAGVEQLARAIDAIAVPIDVLAVNARVGHAGPFAQTSLAGDLEVNAVNVTSAVHLTKLLLPPMVAHGAGRILFTSSVAATMPGPYDATCAAPKAFVQSFAPALRYELKGTGVSVTALMPGPTDTTFFGRAGMRDTRCTTRTRTTRRASPGRPSMRWSGRRPHGDRVRPSPGAERRRPADARDPGGVGARPDDGARRGRPGRPCRRPRGRPGRRGGGV